MNGQDVTFWETTVSATTLNATYRAQEQAFDSGYPEVKNPSALLEGITRFIQQFAGGQIPDHSFIYVVEQPDTALSPENSKYFFMLSKKKSQHTGRTTGYSLRMLYAPTHEVESISMIEEDKVVWSPDTMENTLHRIRTQYYMGFVYMLCLWSPGYDVEPTPEVEMTAAELLKYVKEGEIPSELIEISLDQPQEETGDVEPAMAVAETPQEEQPESELFETEDETEQAEAPQYDVPEVDDTEVVMVSPEEYEEEYNDLQTDYEELFE